jgi:hypothetical protein
MSPMTMIERRGIHLPRTRKRMRWRRGEAGARGAGRSDFRPRHARRPARQEHHYVASSLLHQFIAA